MNHKENMVSCFVEVFNPFLKMIVCELVYVASVHSYPSGESFSAVPKVSINPSQK
jgi:hypothetical protein